MLPAHPVQNAYELSLVPDVLLKRRMLPFIIRARGGALLVILLIPIDFSGFCFCCGGVM